MSALSTIFVGVNPQQARNIIGEYVKSGKWTRFVQPFCGRFGLTEVIADIAESADNIWTSDICVFSWNEPTIPEFKPSEFTDLLRLCEDAEATVLCMQYPSHENIGWRVVASCSMPNRRVNKYWNFVCNKPLKPLVTREFPELSVPDNARFECFINEEIHHGSKVQLVKVDKKVALYYRDLLVHKLADSGGDDHFLLLIDGKVVAVIGLVFNFFTRRGLDYIYLNYAIEVRSNHHSRLHKLITALVYSAQFKQDVISQVSHIQNTLQFRDFSKMRSTKISHTEHLWNMPATAEIVSKEKLENGMFRVVYEHRFTKKRYHQCIVEFWQREQSVKKRGG